MTKRERAARERLEEAVKIRFFEERTGTVRTAREARTAYRRALAALLKVVREEARRG